MRLIDIGKKVTVHMQTPSGGIYFFESAKYLALTFSAKSRGEEKDVPSKIFTAFLFELSGLYSILLSLPTVNVNFDSKSYKNIFPAFCP